MGEEWKESGYQIWYYWLDYFYLRIAWLDMNCQKAWRFFCSLSCAISSLVVHTLLTVFFVTLYIP